MFALDRTEKNEMDKVVRTDMLGEGRERHMLRKILDAPVPGKRWRGRRKTRWKTRIKEIWKCGGLKDK